MSRHLSAFSRQLSECGARERKVTFSEMRIIGDLAKHCFRGACGGEDW